MLHINVLKLLRSCRWFSLSNLDVRYCIQTVTMLQLPYMLQLHVTATSSVPARLGKGQGTKEIGHNLACERQEFRHYFVRKR